MLGTQNNLFRFELPVDVITDNINLKYDWFLKKNSESFSSVIDYLNSTIRNVTFPSLNIKRVSQNVKRKIVEFNAVENVYDLFDKECTITFANMDSNINYLIMLDIILESYLHTTKNYVEPLYITILDKDKVGLYEITYRAVLFTKISDIDFGFNQTLNEDNTFTVGFTFNYVDVKSYYDNEDLISNNI